MNHRGRGRGRGAGGPPRGNGPPATGSSARGNGRGGRGGPPRYKNSLDADLDREVQALSVSLGFSNPNGNGNGAPRGGFRGRGRGGYTPRGGGARTPRFDEFAHTYSTPKGQHMKNRRGSGIGFGSPYPSGRDENHSSYSKMSIADLYNRPLLKPVVFVRAGTLFEDHEEIFKANAPDHEDDDEPTATLIEDVFAHAHDTDTPTLAANTPASTSQVNLTVPSLQANSSAPAPVPSIPRFSEFTVDDVFTTIAADEDDIPVLSWGFTEDQLNATSAGNHLPASLPTASISPPATTDAPTIAATEVVTSNTSIIETAPSPGAIPAPVPHVTPVIPEAPPPSAVPQPSEALQRASASAPASISTIQLPKATRRGNAKPKLTPAGFQPGVIASIPRLGPAPAITPSLAPAPVAPLGAPAPALAPAGIAASSNQIDINQLFRSAALQEAGSSRHGFGMSSGLSGLFNAPNTAAALAPARDAQDELNERGGGMFFLDTEGDHAPPPASETVPEESPAFYIDTEGDAPHPGPSASTTTYNIASVTLSSIRTTTATTTKPPAADESLGFVIDTEGDTAPPSKIRYRVHKLDEARHALGEPTSDSSSNNEEGEETDDGDDVVVFVPPSMSKPKPQPVLTGPTISFANMDMSFPSPGAGKPGAGNAISKQAHTGLHKKQKKMAKRQRRKARKREEARVMKDQDRPSADAQMGSRARADAGEGMRAPRVGDSDIEWGSDGPPGADAGEPTFVAAATSNTTSTFVLSSAGAGPSSTPKAPGRKGRGRHAQDLPLHLADHGMDIDSDLELEDAQYEQMLTRMLQPGEHVTIDDIADEARLRAEDEDQDSRGSSASDDDDDDDAAAIEIDDDASDAGTVEVTSDFKREMALDDDDESEQDSESDEDESEEVSFRTELKRVRERAQVNNTSRVEAEEDSEDDDGDTDDYNELSGGENTWADRDEAAIADLEEVLQGRTAREKREIFRSIQNGKFKDEIVARNQDIVSGTNKQKKKSGEYIPEELKDVWRKDKAKKAERKKAEAEKRRLEAQNPFPAPKKNRRSTTKGKGKAPAPAADDSDSDDFLDEEDEATDASVEITPIVDLVSLAANIRIFIADLGRQTMVLPPMEKKSRERVHQLAKLFSLKSKSVGKGDARRTTLIRTTFTGIGIREGKITAFLRRGGADVPFARAHDRRAGDAGKPAIRHREGEIVGNKAAKIDEGNVGFKLLQRMGWNDGERIGVTGGLAAPLTAVIKNTKLGLGAGTTRWST